MTSPGSPSPAEATKAELRRQALARRDALPESLRNKLSERIAVRVGAIQIPPGPVAIYWPIRSEADPRPAAHELLARGHAIALPCISGDDLVFRAWSPGDALAPAGFGLMEPAATAVPLVPKTLLVPLAAFDRRGHRIGYGRGFYDRALAALGPVTTIGLAFATQEIPLIPDEPHDHPLDFVVTEQETIDTRALRGS